MKDTIGLAEIEEVEIWGKWHVAPVAAEFENGRDSVQVKNDAKYRLLQKTLF
jgi:hypothetical protein